MSNFTDYELAQIAKQAAENTNRKIDDMLRAMTLPELYASRDLFKDQGISIDDDGDLEQVRHDTRPSTFEGDPDPNFGTASLESVEFTRQDNQRMADWRRRQLMADNRRSTFEGSSEPNLRERYGWALPALYAQITSLFQSGDARKIASADSLIKTYERIKAADVTDVCIGYPGCEVEHESMSIADYVRHVEGGI